jgi:predicted CXXCH cytochrome family protein
MKLVYPLLLSMLAAITCATAAEPMPDVITFRAKKGEVTFSHTSHVKGQGTCKTCHDRKGGKIKGLGREWAHKVCRGCHEAIMVGPVQCEGCHKVGE